MSISTDCTGSYKSNYHTITTEKTPTNITTLRIDTTNTNTRRDHRGLDRMVVKSPKQSLGDLLFLLRFFLLLFSFFSFFSFLSLAHELVHGRSQELLDRIS